MLQYNTNLSNRPPIDAAMQAGALKGLYGGGPKSGSAADAYNARAQEAAAEYARAADMANMQYATAQQQAQHGLALQGLRQMADAQQAQSQYYNSLAGSLLGGLFRE